MEYWLPVKVGKGIVKKQRFYNIIIERFPHVFFIPTLRGSSCDSKFFQTDENCTVKGMLH